MCQAKLHKAKQQYDNSKKAWLETRRKAARESWFRRLFRLEMPSDARILEKEWRAIGEYTSYTIHYRYSYQATVPNKLLAAISAVRTSTDPYRSTTGGNMTRTINVSVEDLAAFENDDD